MVFVDVPLNALDLLGDMADMRIWLDRYRIDGTGFSCLGHADGLHARIAFRKPSEAEAFAARFAGRVVPDTGRRSSRTIAAEHHRAGKHAPLEPVSRRMKGELSLQALKQALDREIAEPQSRVSR